VSELQTIKVKHYVQMAHRLFQTAGACQNIHGHSWMVQLTLAGPVDHTGKLVGIDFGELKQKFRSFLDNDYDHRVLLFEGDPWAGKLHIRDDVTNGWLTLPGLQRLECDPTTENFARIIGEWSVGKFGSPDIKFVEVGVWETVTNYASWHWTAND
jgi:6-pyruvoyl tetrahydropterin synthase/QueD family protein